MIKRKLICCISSLDFGGSERVMFNFINAHPQKEAVELVLAASGPLFEKLDPLVKVNVLGCKKSGLSVLLHFRKYFLSFGGEKYFGMLSFFPVIVLKSLIDRILYSGWRIDLYNLRVCNTISIELEYIKKQNKLKYFLQLATYRLAAKNCKLIFQSDFMLDDFTSYVGVCKKPVVIGNPIRSDISIGKLNDDRNGVFFTIGNFEKSAIPKL